MTVSILTCCHSHTYTHTHMHAHTHTHTHSSWLSGYLEVYWRGAVTWKDEFQRKFESGFEGRLASNVRELVAGSGGMTRDRFLNSCVCLSSPWYDLWTLSLHFITLIWPMNTVFVTTLIWPMTTVCLLSPYYDLWTLSLHFITLIWPMNTVYACHHPNMIYEQFACFHPNRTYEHCLPVQLYCPNGISPMGNLGCLPQGKPAATVTLPNLWCMLEVLVFPWSNEFSHGLRDL